MAGNPRRILQVPGPAALTEPGRCHRGRSGGARRARSARLGARCAPGPSQAGALHERTSPRAADSGSSGGARGCSSEDLWGIEELAGPWTSSRRVGARGPRVPTRTAECAHSCGNCAQRSWEPCPSAAAPGGPPKSVFRLRRARVSGKGRGRLAAPRGGGPRHFRSSGAWRRSPDGQRAALPRAGLAGFSGLQSDVIFSASSLGILGPCGAPGRSSKCPVSLGPWISVHSPLGKGWLGRVGDSRVKPHASQEAGQSLLCPRAAPGLHPFLPLPGQRACSGASAGIASASPLCCRRAIESAKTSFHFILLDELVL